MSLGTPLAKAGRQVPPPPASLGCEARAGTCSRASAVHPPCTGHRLLLWPLSMNSLSYSSGGRQSVAGLVGPQSRCWQGQVPSGGCLLEVSRFQTRPLCAPFSIFKPAASVLPCLSDSLSALSRTLVRTLGPPG